MIKNLGHKQIVFLNTPNCPKSTWFCFHFLGGSASSFYAWRKCIPQDIQVIALQLPGREGRKEEDFLSQISEVMQDFYPVLEQYLLNLGPDHPFVFYGHSMGALIAYELLILLEKKLGENKKLAQHHLVVSSCKAPHLVIPKPLEKNMDDDYFIDQLCFYGGTPEIILNDRALLEYFLPRLRADTFLLNSYKRQDLVRLNCPIFAMGGDQDFYIPEESLIRWADCTQCFFDKKMYHGGHFFINDLKDELICSISRFSMQDRSNSSAVLI